jgi:hypothetical protein
MPRLPRLAAPLLALFAAAGYFAVLVVTRELGSADLATLRALGSKRRA